MGASKVKWTNHDPCLVLSDNDPNYTLTIDFVKKKIIDIDKTYWVTKPSSFKKSLHIWEDGASGVQVSDVEQAIV